MKLTAVLVDDEDDNNLLLERFLIDYCPEIFVIAKCGSMHDAFLKIKDLRPDVIFLDINLGAGEDSFQLLDLLPELNSKIIFITAYPEFGHRAFRYAATDYLLKPLKLKELIDAVARLAKPANETSASLLNARISENNSSTIELKTFDGIVYSDPNNILYIEALGRGCFVHFVNNDEVLEITEQLGKIEAKLIRHTFYRVHKAFLVNLAQVKSVTTKGDFLLEMKPDFYIPVARRTKSIIKQLLNLP